MISENTAKMVGGSYMPIRLGEVMEHKPKLQQGEATARIKAKLR